MAMSSILNADDIKKALDAFAVADSFDHKKFFEVVGLKSKSPDDVKKVFTVLDADNSGRLESEARFLTESSVSCSARFVLKGFAKDGRDMRVCVDLFLIFFHLLPQLLKKHNKKRT